MVMLVRDKEEEAKRLKERQERRAYIKNGKNLTPEERGERALGSIFKTITLSLVVFLIITIGLALYLN